MSVTVALIKQLREMTGAGIMDAKKALTETNGNIEEAVTYLRKQGMAASAKKADRIAAEGITGIKTEGNTAVVYEVNAETDFVARNENFLSMIEEIGNALLVNDVNTNEEALALEINGETIEEAIIQATATIGEKISFRRFARVVKSDDQVFGTYVHTGGRISAVVVGEGIASDVANNVAMQVASMNPKYVSREDIADEDLAKEKEIQESILANDESLQGKPQQVLDGIIQGRISKTMKDFTLVDQDFFMDAKLSVGQYLKENNGSVLSFVRYELGDGIEKRVEDFAAEVEAQLK
ncbi:MAG: elongation factor Ts [Erysipelothrix sp.]|nr:elongation factor Ts [Erysipelothrix sp.]